MGEFEEKMNAILGNKEAMGQIMALAQSLGKPAPPPRSRRRSLGSLGGSGPAGLTRRTERGRIPCPFWAV